MAATTCGARKHAWTKNSLGKKRQKKDGEEKSRRKQWPASLRPPPRVAHASMPGPIVAGTPEEPNLIE